MGTSQSLAQSLLARPRRGKNNDVQKIIMKGSPQSLAGVFAAQLEADPVVAAQVKEHLPPEKLIRLLGLDDWLKEQLACAACAAEPVLPLETPAQPGELQIRSVSIEHAE